ncbi:MAG: HD domain-containing protein [Polaromonas sp.]|uniref:phosphonate degradation HD-domain oxygenase n=1 Tax=Polaromonas sp. TaxID=1869339 RepID=UPI002720D1B6|nr:phosphonate degradation HD-domain oxygenase [Polaromonas sp.]MDO9113698.1 HD domain-containing protein [Polaromonas sp.]MDP1885716.1 HD domain-containing protein [Polaromonas sp.]MDP3249617.1 HD domain-containing protein [Polaromonas sp.]
MALKIEEITAVFQTRGAAQYGGEAINQLQHALQCAHLAERSGAPPALVAAALLHDLGHLLVQREPAKEAGVDDLHQFLALPFLRGAFPDAVLEPIRMHVDAKRYLCQVDNHYQASLSPASQRSLALQGGPFSGEEAAAFMAQAFAADAVALRRWDDHAKDPAATPPDWAHYIGVLKQAASAVPAEPVR